MKMSPTPPRSAENATIRPSGEKDGDSGSSTDFIGTRDLDRSASARSGR